MHQERQPAVQSARVLHTGKKFDFVSLRVRRPSGNILDREIVRHPGAVVVVPITDDRRLVLIKNYRIAVNDWLYECCAGTIERARLSSPTPTSTFVPFGEPGAEDPGECAARELVEETGFQAARLKSLGWYFTTPGMTDEQMFAFLATGLTHVGQRLEEDEAIDVELVPIGEALAMVRDGRIRDAKSMLAILLAQQQGFL
jgi:ADP-ribose pyrophosphatase